MTLLVGTASWTDRTLLESGTFYPESVKSPEARLRFYASQFNLVEVDTSYYAIPSVTTAQHWAERTAPGFVFNVKAFSLFTGQWTSTDVLPKDIKQALGAGRRMVYKDMAEELREELWRRFAACLVPLRANSKLGLVHFQFSPKVSRHKAAVEHIEHCLEHLPGHTLSIEFRNPSWWENAETTAETLAMLRELGMVHTIVDGPQGSPYSVPAIWETTHPEHALLRLHGRNVQAYVMPAKTAAERFDYAYTADELQALAQRFNPITRSVKYAHSVFNNCMEDKSQLNAKAFRALLMGMN
ncbi:hypothetical protein CBP34_08040 [Acidovorax carolinensis]|uniref:DUF72 domain-containing protein n=1 Tax=Acidovorax carolinensis TaxID=553814 RepID=A0A240U2I4_9BURK|nr:DUF72 domain-containing protein [Acidovorax carolinensis]ART51623.1 hypothetical protein CBP34_08040 [Acidovorax carolinensis]